MDPPMSLPCASGTMPDVTATAAPPLDPPGVRERSHGLSVRPCTALSVNQRMASAEELLRPIRIAPARRSVATCGLSVVATVSLKAATPWVVA